VKRVVYAASSSAYGEAEADKKSEDLPCRPISPYAVSKLAGELYCAAFTHVYGLETVALRYFNVFGPRQAADSAYSAVIPRFITALLHGHPPTIYGDGEQTRDFTYVDNVVDGNLRALTAPAAPGQVMNLATGGRTSLNELAATLGEIMGSALRPVHAPRRSGDIRDSSADTRRAAAVLGYSPSVSLYEGLRRTVAWLRQHAAPVPPLPG
jgi:UDP-glucose 4-epimerase